MTIHKEGTSILLTAYTVLALCALLVYGCVGSIPWLAWTGYAILAIFGVFFLCFFRKPNRALRLDDHAAISPADGKVIAIQEVFENEYLKERRIQVSIFMSIFNVHINWFPVSGQVEYFKHHNGHFHVASHPKSSDKNEHTTIVVNHQGHKILFRQIAGLIARRIVSYVQTGKEVLQCSQAGFIKFGSRIDLLLPLDSRIEVKVGQKVKGGKTVIAHYIHNTTNLN